MRLSPLLLSTVASLTMAYSPLLAVDTSKPRVIVTTDGEIDDKCSFDRFLLYTNDMDVAGLIYVNSKFHYPGHDYIAPNWIPSFISKYASVYPNLLKHDASYPSPSRLSSLIKVGNVTTQGGMAGVG